MAWQRERCCGLRCNLKVSVESTTFSEKTGQIWGTAVAKQTPAIPQLIRILQLLWSCSGFASIILEVSVQSGSTSYFLLLISSICKIFVLILFNHNFVAAWMTLRGTNDLCRKNTDIARLPGILWDSQTHRFHVPCQHSDKEVSPQSVL